MRLFIVVLEPLLTAGTFPAYSAEDKIYSYISKPWKIGNPTIFGASVCEEEINGARREERAEERAKGERAKRRTDEASADKD